MDIAPALAAAGNALGITKELLNINRQLDDAAFKIKIAELTTALANAQIGLVDANMEIHKLQQEIRELKSSLSFSDKTKKVNDWTYECSEDGIAFGDPFCPRCIEVDGKYIKLRSTSSKVRYDELSCPNCSRTFGHVHRLSPLEQIRATESDSGILE